MFIILNNIKVIIVWQNDRNLNESRLNINQYGVIKLVLNKKPHTKLKFRLFTLKVETEKFNDVLMRALEKYKLNYI